MKRFLLLTLCILACAATWGQGEAKPLKGTFVNDEYDVFLEIDLYEETVEVAGHELLGPLNGYLGKHSNTFCWLITKSTVKGEDKAEISLINDYGSEDLEATITAQADGTITLHQGRGSTLKMASKGKWQKLPATLEFKKK